MKYQTISFKYIADSMKIALGIGNCALGSYCLDVTQAIITVSYRAQMPKAQLPMTYRKSNLF